PCTDQPPTEISPLSLHDALPILIVTHRHVTIDADDGKPLLVGAQRAPARPAHVEPVDTEGGDGEVGVVPRAEDCDIGQVETETDLVEQRGAEGVHVLSRQAAVREGSVEIEVRVQLIIRKVAAGANVVKEHLVLLAEILVDAHQTLVGGETALRYAGVVYITGGVG